MPGRFTIRWGLLAVCACALGLSRGTAADEPLRLLAGKPGNQRVVRVAADEAVEVVEGEWKYLRLLGSVFIDQGGYSRVRAARAVIRIDQGRVKREGEYWCDIYAEGDVALEHGPSQQRGAQAIVGLASTREPVLQLSSVAVQPSLATDPFFQRARAAWTPAAPIVLTGASGTPTADLPNILPPPSGTPPPGPEGFQNIPLNPSAPNGGFFAPPAQPAPPRILRIAPRTGRRFEMESLADQNAILVTGGIILNITNVDRLGILDVEADNLVIWTKGDAQQVFQSLQSGQGESTRENEFYMSGNVVLRAGLGREERVLRADQLYYDVSRNVAVAISAEIEFRDKALPNALHFKADEVFQLGADDFKAIRAEVFSSRLPSDPGLKLVMGQARLSQRRVPRTSVLGLRFIDRETGLPEDTTERYFQGEGVQLRVANIPVFATGFVQGTTSNPTGPIRSVTFTHDNIFGYRLGAELDVFNLLGVNPPPGSRWSAMVDWLSKRGPGGGTNYDYAGDGLFGFTGRYSGQFRLYGMLDDGVDVLGGPRTGEPHPDFRGRVFWRHFQNLSDGWQVMAQVSVLSDKNYLEQYHKPEFDLEPNQETFAYLNKRERFWGVNLLVEPRLRDWVTETVWLPKAEGRIVGWAPLDFLTYNARASVGYAQLRPTEIAPPPVLPTDARINTGRFDLWQELSAPLPLGPLKIVPFATMDVAAYTSDLNGDPRGRFYIGGGARASLPFSRLYADVRSDLLNVQSIYHKAVLGGTYYASWTNVPYSDLPQLDRLNDDATDQAIRDITPLQPGLNPDYGVALATSPIFNPQLYAIRRLVDNRADTLDKIQVFQLDLRQRWQTKRGFPGMQHTVDLLMVDLSMSLFPNPTRDNFGSVVSFVEYDVIWNVGDRTSLVSNGWFDPFDAGTRYVTVTGNLNRPDGTLFQLGYRHTDPINSRLLTAAASYVFSQKYSMTASSSYDFGPNKGLWNSLVFTRTGTDLQLSVGVNYNPLTNNFGFSLNLLPILVAHQRRAVAPGNLGYGRVY